MGGGPLGPLRFAQDCRQDVRRVGADAVHVEFDQFAQFLRALLVPQDDAEAVLANAGDQFGREQFVRCGRGALPAQVHIVRLDGQCPLDELVLPVLVSKQRGGMGACWSSCL